MPVERAQQGRHVSVRNLLPARLFQPGEHLGVQGPAAGARGSAQVTQPHNLVANTTIATMLASTWATRES